MSRLVMHSGSSFPGNDSPTAAQTIAALRLRAGDLYAWDGRQVALAIGVAVAAAVAAGLGDPAHLGVLAVSTSSAAAGACLIGHGPRPAPGVALVAAPLVAVPVLGLPAPLFLLAGALTYALLYVRLLAPRTPFAIVAAGAAAGCFALAGWSTAASSLQPAALLLAATVFLWVPGHAWSLSLAAEGRPGARSLRLLPAVAGRRRAAAAVSATSVAVVIASLLLVPWLSWPYPVLAVPAAACLLEGTLELRLHPDRASARRAYALSEAYLWVIVGALVVASV